MFALPDSWVWDFWFADDGDRFLMFFLYASKALRDPEARHYRASVGHAVSTDLRAWTRVEDTLVRADAPAFDDLATWTGSVVRNPAGGWEMFYTGSTRVADGRNIQRIGRAHSEDLYTWTRSGNGPALQADGEWYETLDKAWQDEAFRDPWVFRDPASGTWHMLVTARSGHLPDTFSRGVVGHATSPDLTTWSLEPPLTEPAPGGFGQLEVMQTEIVEGQAVLIFSCLAEHASLERRGTSGGVWAAPAAGLLGPFAIDQAYPLTDDSLYSGRLVQDRVGAWQLLAFKLATEDVPFVGEISDPLPVAWRDGRLTVEQE